MTNRQKFIEVMNSTFAAGLTEDNFNSDACSPCGIFKKGACEAFICEGCAAWWEKEYLKSRDDE